MYKVKNLRTGNFIKNAIDRKVFMYATKEDAEKAASTMNVYAVADRKRDRYTAVQA